MVERLLEQFSQYLPLSQEERAAIKASALIRHYPPGKVITMDSCSRQNSFFVLQGLIREYELTPKEEVNLHFYTENDWILNLDSSNPKDSTDEPQRRLVAMEPSDLVVGNEEKAQALFKTSPRLMAVAQKIIEEQAAAYQRKIRAYRTSDPEQRFLDLLEQRPDLFQRLSQAHIASYIDVRPESLSRIRKRLYERRNNKD
jgi:CRP-like cAMP-binding protein